MMTVKYKEADTGFKGKEKLTGQQLIDFLFPNKDNNDNQESAEKKENPRKEVF